MLFKCSVKTKLIKTTQIMFNNFFSIKCLWDLQQDNDKLPYDK